MRRLVAAIASIGMMSSPVMAQGAMADRASSPVGQSEDLAAPLGAGGGMVFLLAAFALLAGVVVVVDDDDPDFDDEPVSP